MELLDQTKGKTTEHRLGDVTIIAKTEANEEDRMLAAFASRRKGEPWGPEQHANLCRTVCRLMIVDWKGVTHEGKPVDYDFELLKQLPRQHDGKNLYISLYLWLIKETDIFKGATEKEKNA